MDDEPKYPTSHASVMFADVSRSTELYETVGDMIAFEAIARCIALMKSRAEAAGGRIVKTIGDEVMVVFPSAELAMQAAIDMQLAVSGLPSAAGQPMSLRIGFHHGPVLPDETGDVFGDTVNLAARLTGMASPGQIVTSKDAIECLSARLREMARYLYPIRMRGKRQSTELFEAIWQQGTDLTIVGNGQDGADGQAGLPGSSLLTLRYGDACVEMSEASPLTTIGRGANMSVVVRDCRASRVHASVECRAGQYVLRDCSSNGTRITIDGGHELILRRDEVTLWGHGWISFGPFLGDEGERVEFSFTHLPRAAG
ncbi:adenylate/guanylate cyclase domain-containing protein [Paraburkholderia azotifigens]|uniref:Adenylate/guanylate cyclase domain-containing protein n=1 Tax=Paraburkholderia azotifigens TaxID=2057004 RepID=A0A5C6VHT4_9BURK|nr:adenylate/guanylate cyclase domain-containing protein [Paraburkholderia azotifigens]TXC84490.1 adenylate/guanylate cyclase domain-containing protein [Paraburkholderia azotifigens]